MNYQEDIFIHMQVFLELFLKTLFKEAQIDTGKRRTLGSLIQNEQLFEKLKRHYPFLNFTHFNSVKFMGNEKKHEFNDIPNHYVEKQMVAISTMVTSYLKMHQIEVERFSREDVKGWLKEDLRLQSIEQTYQKVMQENHKKMMTRLEDYQKEYDYLSAKIGGVIEPLSEIDFSQDIEKTQKKVELINQEINDLESRREAVMNQMKQPDLSEELSASLMEEKNDIISSISKLEEELDRAEKRLIELTHLKHADLDTLERNKITDRLDELEEDMSLIKTMLNQHDEKFETMLKRDDYYARMQKLHTSLHIADNVKFMSNYVDDKQFAVTNISQNNAATSAYKSIYATIFNSLIRGQVIKPSNNLLLKDLDDESLSQIFALEITLLMLLKSGRLGDGEWVIKTDDDKENLLTLAYENIIYKAEKISLLTALNYQAPSLSINATSNIVLTFERINLDASVCKILYLALDENDNKPDLWIEDEIVYTLNHLNQTQQDVLEELLFEWFNHKAFRRGQYKILANFLNGHSTIGVLPTGSGKSMIFYMAALLQPKQSLVVAPLTTLIDDQVTKLKDHYQFHNVGLITSDISAEEKVYHFNGFKEHKLSMLFVSPERLQMQSFRSALYRLGQKKAIGSVILDEVHCLSDWGHDFRVAYLMLAKTVNDYLHAPKFLGLTATASINVIQDLMIELKIHQMKHVIFSREFKRDNLMFRVSLFENDEEMKGSLVSLLRSNISKKTAYDLEPREDNDNTGIIFCRTTKNTSTSVETIHGTLEESLKSSFSSAKNSYIGSFYGSKKSDFKPFMLNQKRLLVATKAFGMGVDKPNIRFTIHYGLPSSREAFYQEAGRAGRDERLAYCHLFTSKPNEIDKEKISKFLSFKTNIEDLISIAKSFSRENFISTNSFFLTKDLASPQAEAFKLKDLYNRVLNDETSYIIGKDKSGIEKLLHLFYKLGILSNWTVDYYKENGSSKTRIQLELNKKGYKDITHIKDSARAYLKSYRAQKKYLEKVDGIKSLDEIEILFLLVREWYHETFIRNQREQLANMVEFAEKNAENNDSKQIQQELDDYFDLSSLYDEETSILNIDLNDESYHDIMLRTFDIAEDNLNLVQANTERVIESFTNTKIDLYMSLIHLRQGTFLSSRNGQERFELAYDQMNEEEKSELVKSLSEVYDILIDAQKVAILNVLHLHRTAFDQMILKHEDCKVLNGFLATKVNHLLTNLWGEDDHA